MRGAMILDLKTVIKIIAKDIVAKMRKPQLKKEERKLMRTDLKTRAVKKTITVRKIIAHVHIYIYIYIFM